MRDVSTQSFRLCTPPQPIVALPVIEVPFEYIGMDIVLWGYKYILGSELLCHLISRSHTALRRGSFKNVTKELFMVCSLVDIPKEILSDTTV